MDYDGTTPLQTALAELYGLSVKSQAQLALLVKEAKAALGINTVVRILTPDQRLAVYQWHKDKLSPVQNVKQDSEPLPDDDSNNPDGEPVYDFKQIHFAVAAMREGQPKRTTVMLEGYLVKALQRKHGLTDNSSVRAWIENAVKADGARYDSYAPLTRQVMRIIIESLV
jgi:hypothetical protein